MPSLAEITKNPMKYLAEAAQRFEALSQQVKAQGKAIIEIANHVKSSDQKLAPLITAIEKAQAAQPHGAATTVGSNQSAVGGQLGAQLVPMLLSALAGGGSNPMQERMFNAMFEKTMMGMDLSNALTKAMIIKLAPDLADELSKSLVKKTSK